MNAGSTVDKRGPWPDLAKRVASAVVMAALALGTDWLGGWFFALFWTAAAVIVLIEWEWIVLRRRWPIVLGSACVVFASLAAATGRVAAAFLVVMIGAALVYLIRRPEAGRHLAAAGVIYAAAIALPIILLRADPVWGATCVLFLFAVVWGTDVMAYFVGRTVGGPKLWPRISPNKTWSGFVGGVVSGAVAGVTVLWFAAVPSYLAVIPIALLLAVTSQGGDLFESWLKRRYGAKDASHIIPGHGGVMDRLDGFVAAGALGFLIGSVRMPDAAATGLLVW
jgi:phosphatidate cytidylyltransferase